MIGGDPEVSMAVLVDIVDDIITHGTGIRWIVSEYINLIAVMPHQTLSLVTYPQIAVVIAINSVNIIQPNGRFQVIEFKLCQHWKKAWNDHH